MQIHSLNFTVQLEEGDPRPTGTTPEQAAQIWQAIIARQLSTLRVKTLNYRDEGVEPYFEVSAVGNEILDG